MPTSAANEAILDRKRGCVRLAVTLTAGLAAACVSSATSVSTTGIVNLSVTATGDGRDTTFVFRFDSDTTAYPIHVDSVLSLSTQEGTHEIELADIADNCSLDGDNPRTVLVTAGEHTDVVFAVACSLNGYAKVTIVTTGVDLDDIYTLDFNNGFRSLLVGPNQFVKPSLPVGQYSVELRDVAANCTVTTANPISLTVAADSVTDGSFAVACVAK
jgi:hypothetical protein